MKEKDQDFNARENVNVRQEIKGHWESGNL
jgi:hypothetical protein